jgi:hypothetical protein
VLRFELNLSQKVLERRAREALPLEIEAYRAKLTAFYSYPEQMLFVDETKTSGDSMRKYAWSRRGEKAIVRVPFRKGMCVDFECKVTDHTTDHVAARQVSESLS